MQSGIKSVLGSASTIVTDTQTAAAAEIIIGSTSRTVGGVNLNGNEYCIYTDSGRLVIQAGNSSLLTTAVNEFMKAVQSASDLSEDVPELRGTVSDFATSKTVSGTLYSYTWGDEFNASSLDTTVWSFRKVETEGVPSDTKMLEDENCITENDGNLHLKTIEYEDSNYGNILFASPWSITTAKSMNYKYGYLEMRAKIPVVQGSWCSFWLTSGKINGTPSPYGVEVDVFESQSLNLTPNLHKWYDSTGSNITDVAYNSSPASKYHDLTSSSKKIQKYSASESFKDSYHLIGFEWTPKKMVMYVDNVPYMAFDITDDYESYTNTGNSSSGCMQGFHNPLEVIIGCGLYSPAYVNPHQPWAEPYMIKDLSVLPFDFAVDYIRLYQRSGEGQLIKR